MFRAKLSVGWGVYLGQFLNIPVTNNAIGGRSARSFTDEGRFASIISAVAPGDFVVIEFGHNDGSAGTGPDNGRQDTGTDGYSDTAVVHDARCARCCLLGVGQTTDRDIAAGTPSRSTRSTTTSRTR